MNEFGGWDSFVSVVNRAGFAWKNLLGQDTGAVDLRRNGGILFPATQVSSANANTLDDYEEGSWTPALAFGGGTTGITYGTTVGEYTKIGRLVTLHATITLTSKGSSTGVAVVTGAPFTTPFGGAASVGAGYWTTMTSSLVNLTVVFFANAINIGLYGLTAGATSIAALDEGDFADNSSITFSVAYHTS